MPDNLQTNRIGTNRPPRTGQSWRVDEHGAGIGRDSFPCHVKLRRPSILAIAPVGSCHASNVSLSRANVPVSATVVLSR